MQPHRCCLFLLRPWTLCLLGLLLAGPVSIARASSSPPLNRTAGELPPFAWLGPQGPQGYAYELVVQMSARLGRPSEVKFYPWARAVRAVGGSDALGVFPLARTPDREAHFRWLIPLAHVRYTFFGRSTGTLDLLDLDALRGARIGVLRGSPIARHLREQRFGTLIEAKDYKELLRLLSGGLIDGIYAGEPMLMAAIELHGFPPQDFRSGLHLGGAELYMATTLKLDEAEAQRWLQAYRQLQQEGVVARLQKKYLR